VTNLKHTIGAYLALAGARLELSYLPLNDLLSGLKTHPVTLPNDLLERLLERERLRYPGFTCLHAALVFRKIKPVRICLGVNPMDVADGHAWVKDQQGHVWLKGMREWREIWSEQW
jgi:hypothetical protein